MKVARGPDRYRTQNINALKVKLLTSSLKKLTYSLFFRTKSCGFGLHRIYSQIEGNEQSEPF